MHVKMFIVQLNFLLSVGSGEMRMFASEIIEQIHKKPRRIASS
jgi:hypothetical protein